MPPCSIPCHILLYPRPSDQSHPHDIRAKAGELRPQHLLNLANIAVDAPIYYSEAVLDTLKGGQDGP